MLGLYRVTDVSSLLSWPFLWTVAAGVGTLYLVQYLVRYWEKPGAKWFVLTLSGQALFCFSYAAGMTVFDPARRFWFEVAALAGLNLMCVPFLGFALAYTGRGRLVRSWTFVGLCLFAASIVALLPFNGWHNLFWTEFEAVETLGVAVASYEIQPLFFLGIFVSAVAAGVGTLLLTDTVLSYGPLYRREALAVALSPIPPAAGFMLWLFSVGPYPDFNLAATLVLPHVLLDAYAFVGKGMFEFYPATNRAAERSAIDDLRSPVFVLDENGRVVDLNDPAVALFGITADEAVTQPVSTVVGEDIDPTETNRQLSLHRDGTRAVFSVESAPLTDSGGNHVGYTLLFQDVTEEVQREERLSVLNRVLRHNLRNDLSVVTNYVEISRERSESDEIQDMLTRADDKVQELVATGETAREIERTIGSEDCRDTVSLDTTLGSVVETVRSEFPEATVTLDSIDSTSVYTDADVLRSVVEELLTNAIEHNDAGTPTVEITVTESTGAVELTISDDGPGIPDHELQVLDSGEETALEHGSGLGLWLVRWGVLRLGAEIAFDVDDGTTVTLSLPAEADTTPVDDGRDGPAG